MKIHDVNIDQEYVQWASEIKFLCSEDTIWESVDDALPSILGPKLWTGGAKKLCRPS